MRLKVFSERKVGFRGSKHTDRTRSNTLLLVTRAMTLMTRAWKPIGTAQQRRATSDPQYSFLWAQK